MVKLSLVSGDYNNPLHPKMVDYLKVRIDDLRRMNDGDFDLVKTSRIRGGIKELQKLLTQLESIEPS